MTADSKTKTSTLLALMVEYESATQALDAAKEVVVSVEARIADALAGRCVKPKAAAPVSRKRGKRASPGNGTVHRLVTLLNDPARVAQAFSIKQIAREVGAKRHTAHAAISKAAAEGKVRRVGRGLYQGMEKAS